MIRVGIAGLGFMGKMHFRCYKTHDDVNIAAVCDSDEKNFTQSTEEAGNIAGAEKPLDFTGIALYSDFDKMLSEANLDAVSICLPTYMHRDFSIKALKAGVNVLCEKPMAMDQGQCEEMIAAVKKSGKILQVGHCIRFWPEYVKTKQLIDAGEYGRVKAASFRRLSLTPTWSWDNWIVQQSRSGGALLDLHIHDADYIHYVFGMPKTIFCKSVNAGYSDFDHVVAQYIYDDDKVIIAEGGWSMAPSFGFEMSFNIILEKASIIYDCTRHPAFKVCVQGIDEPVTPKLLSGDGYSNEIDYFIKQLSGEKVTKIITPEQSLDTIRLIEAEKESAYTGKVVEIK